MPRREPIWASRCVLALAKAGYASSTPPKGSLLLAPRLVKGGARLARAMSTPQTSRRQRNDATLAFSPAGFSTFVRHDIVRQRDRVQGYSLLSKTCCAVLVGDVEQSTVSAAAAPTSTSSAPARKAPVPPRGMPSLMVTTMPNTSPPTGYVSRFAPVPDPQPHEILRPQRGRNSRRRRKEAEYFRRYMYLRRQLKPWSDDFRQKHGRTPSLLDVHASNVPGLLDRFVEYLDALEGLRVEV